MNRKNSKLAALILTVIFLAGCGAGLVTQFRAGFAASKPFIQSLVPSVISQTKADAAIADVDESLRYAEQTEACIAAIPEGTKRQRQVGKARCYITLAVNLRSVLARHNISGSPRLDQIATIAQAAALAFEQYYRSVNPDGVVRTRGAVADSDPDKTLEVDLKARLKELKEATAH